MRLLFATGALGKLHFNSASYLLTDYQNESGRFLPRRRRLLSPRTSSPPRTSLRARTGQGDFPETLPPTSRRMRPAGFLRLPPPTCPTASAPARAAPFPSRPSPGNPGSAGRRRRLSQGSGAGSAVLYRPFRGVYSFILKRRWILKPR